MTYFNSFVVPGETGFRVLAGRRDGLRRLVVASGWIPLGAPSQMHLHHGDEVIRIVSGEVLMRVGDERQTCGPGDIVVVPPRTLHGFRVVADATMEVVAEQDIGTFWPVRDANGSTRLVQIHTPTPWNAPPPDGVYTTEEELADLRRRIAAEI
ncbi:MAG TPA: cupin domain-containing protein [Candidatus Limnocylindrales bacterium]